MYLPDLPVRNARDDQMTCVTRKYAGNSIQKLIGVGQFAYDNTVICNTLAYQHKRNIKKRSQQFTK